MATRMIPRLSPFASTSRTLMRLPARSFHASATARAEAIAAGTVPNVPVKKPVGAFRGGLFGFLLGASSAFAGFYYYVLDEYKLSNGMLTEDIYALQSAVQRIEGYVKELETKIDKSERKK